MSTTDSAEIGPAPPPAESADVPNPALDQEEGGSAPEVANMETRSAGNEAFENAAHIAGIEEQAGEEAAATDTAAAAVAAAKEGGPEVAAAAVAVNPNPDELTAAAVKLQAAERGRKARSQVKDMQALAQTEGTVVDSLEHIKNVEEAERATTLLQASR